MSITRFSRATLWAGRKLISTAMLSWVVTLAAPARAQAADAEQMASLVQKDVTRQRLDNGLRVIFSVNPSSRTVAICSVYAAGTRDESSEAVAHLTELMVRGGKQGASDPELSRLITARGGRLEAETFVDRTRFCTLLPASELAFGIWLEARRFSSPDLGAEALERERSTALAEYRARVLSRTYGRGPERLRQLAFQGLPAYERSVLGSLEAIKRIRLDDVRHFHGAFYRPDHAIVSIAGDFDPKRAVALVREHLGNIRPSVVPAPAARSGALVHRAPPRQTTERFSSLDEATAKTPAALYGWVIPAASAHERRTLELLATLLANAEGSVSNRDLVRRQAVVREVSAWFDDHATADPAPILFVVRMLGSARTTPDQLRKQLDIALTRLRYNGPSAVELERARQKLRSDLVFRLESNFRRAAFLAELELATGDARLVRQAVEGHLAVKPADVRRLVVDHLGNLRRTVVELYPPHWFDPTAPPMPKYHIVNDGENLIIIAKKHGVKVEALVTANSLNPKKPIFPGQKLVVPKGKKVKVRTHTVKKGDTLIAIAKRYSVSVKALIAKNQLKPRKPIVTGQALVIPD